MASRLSEDPARRILLLEAGDEETKDARIDVPLAADQLLRTEFDWGSLTTPQTHACKGMGESGKGMRKESMVHTPDWSAAVGW